MDRCEVPRCRDEASIIYLGRGVCEEHWNKYTADDAPEDGLRVVLGLPPTPVAAIEAVMDDGSKGKAEAVEAPWKRKGRTKATSKKYG
ncbi:MAG: hypothetical protein ACREAA_13690 [Candidatus Polarisedimenticolia bacterium]